MGPPDNSSSAAGLRATQTAEDPFNAWYNLSVLYATRNDSAGAERSLRSAIAANPTWFKPHWMLAQVLSTRGNREEARAEAALAAFPSGSWQNVGPDAADRWLQT